MKISPILFTVVATCAITSSCGKSSSKKDPVTTKTDVISNVTASTQAAQAQVDEVAAALVDDMGSGAPTSSFLTTGTDVDETPGVTRTCAAAADTAGSILVTWTLSLNQTKEVERPRANLSTVHTKTGTVTRLWTPPTGQTITCNTTTNRPKIPWKKSAAVQGLTLTQTLDRTDSFTTTVTPKNTKIAGYENSRTVKTEGTRTISWSATTPATDGATYTLTKSLTASTAKRTITTVKKGATVSLISTVSVTSPIVMDIVRSTSDNSWVSRTVKSGTTVATQADSTKVESTFSDIVFEASNTEPCIPSSGSITGKVYAAGATIASKSYLIKFDAGTVYMDYAEGETAPTTATTEFEDYEGKCDFAGKFD